MRRRSHCLAWDGKRLEACATLGRALRWDAAARVRLRCGLPMPPPRPALIARTRGVPVHSCGDTSRNATGGVLASTTHATLLSLLNYFSYVTDMSLYL